MEFNNIDNFWIYIAIWAAIIGVSNVIRQLIYQQKNKK